MRSVRITAPAKINLGLEILGRRDAGLHEIATVMAMVDLCDVIELTPGVDAGITRAEALDGISQDEDLTVRALRLLETCGVNVRIGIDKRIPVAAGLGGASADAAATLVAGSIYLDHPIDTDILHNYAARLGSDVPFFLGSPCALATGTGTMLEPLPAPRGWVVIVTPPLQIERKTARMYAALTPADFTDGARVGEVVHRLRVHQLPYPESLCNAFTRSLYAMEPSLARIPEIMRDQDAPFVTLSGAGPSHYTWLGNATDAGALAQRLASTLPEGTRIFVAPFATLRLEDRLAIAIA